MEHKVGWVVVGPIAGAEEEGAAVNEDQNWKFGLSTNGSIAAETRGWKSDREVETVLGLLFVLVTLFPMGLSSVTGRLTGLVRRLPGRPAPAPAGAALVLEEGLKR